MNELQSLSQIFQNKIFRIPDYQRGYAWQDLQLRDFQRRTVSYPELLLPGPEGHVSDRHRRDDLRPREEAPGGVIGQKSGEAIRFAMASKGRQQKHHRGRKVFVTLPRMYKNLKTEPLVALGFIFLSTLCNTEFS